MECQIPSEQSRQKAKHTTRLLQASRGYDVAISQGKVTCSHRQEPKFDEEEDADIDEIRGNACHKVRNDKDSPDCTTIQSMIQGTNIGTY